MKTNKVILLGVQAWGILFSAFTLSSYLQIFEDPILQETLVMTVSALAVGILGSAFYYRKGARMHGLTLAAIMAAVAIVLDAVITVPLFIQPQGGSYQGFFTSPFFWMIISTYAGSIFLYWRIAVKGSLKTKPY